MFQVALESTARNVRVFEALLNRRPKKSLYASIERIPFN